jgi:hypothetical protein
VRLKKILAWAIAGPLLLVGLVALAPLILVVLVVEGLKWAFKEIL